jgi:hypothetical protein
MPLTKKGKQIMGAMRSTYGKEKGERVFYASIAKGKVKGAERKRKRKSKTRRS